MVIREFQTFAIIISDIDSEQHTDSNRCPLLKSASTNVIISNHSPV